MNEPHISLTHTFEGFLAPSDLLISIGSLFFSMIGREFKKNGLMFLVKSDDFLFSLSIQNQSIILERNETKCIFNATNIIEQDGGVRALITWTPERLGIECGTTDDRKCLVNTSPAAPPASLIRWARKTVLLPTESYASEEVFRSKVYTCLLTINEKIKEAGAYKSFWNISYEGNAITDRKPKIEVDIHPIIHCFLSDQMLLANIEVIPEYKSGVGNLDFLFIGQVKGVGMSKLCAEFKLAHSDDLEHGLIAQLPEYMTTSQASYGAYCVLNFKGDWFDRPVFSDGKELCIHLHQVKRDSGNPIAKNIRTFIFDLAKPKTASN